MNPTVSVLIVTPQGLIYEGEVDKAYFPAIAGPLGILPGHTPFIAGLSSQGVIRLEEDHQILFYAIRGGVLEVKPERTIALTEFAQKAASEEEARNLAKAPKGVSLNPNGDVKEAQSILLSRLSLDAGAVHNPKKP